MITHNVNVALGGINGMQCTITGLHEPASGVRQATATHDSIPVLREALRELHLENWGLLAWQPEYAIVRLPQRADGQTLQVRGFEANELPIHIRKTTFKSSGNVIHRMQLPLDNNLFITTHKAQGHTLGTTIIDIAVPPTGQRPNMMALLVSLLRLTRWSDVYLVRGFPEELLHQGFPAVLKNYNGWNN
eukprot:TRINITY_DN5767_c0_g2_i1.p1 TRINITY_DN5767_c0_g2~~TRINITY_DN5767_c0_g2_i1.p1  ORF type:complete len:189 (+),score=28.26 TRINITY_DN5767_c0_g2_i1:199-765(+)